MLRHDYVLGRRLWDSTMCRNNAEERARRQVHWWVQRWLPRGRGRPAQFGVVTQAHETVVGL
eukprot:scaffold50834_cov102-Phaeocystis_antarctica.AAC.6